jgi:two-component system, NarL family, nitrate/nitrite response regulator NarL
MNKEPISIVIADDHPMLLDGLRGLIESAGAYTIVAECRDGEAALHAIKRHAPHLAVLDLNMPKRTGLEVLQAVTYEGLPTRIVLIAATMRDAEIQTALDAGAYGILFKETASDTVLDCIKNVLEGTRVFPPDLLDALEREAARRKFAGEVSAKLTARELEVALLVTQGFSNKDIARRLNVTEGTVKLHLHNVFSKMGVTKRNNLTSLIDTIRDRLVDVATTTSLFR